MTIPLMEHTTTVLVCAYDSNIVHATHRPPSERPCGDTGQKAFCPVSPSMQRRYPDGCRLKTVVSPTDLPERQHQIGAAAIDGIQTLLTGRYGRLS